MSFSFQGKRALWTFPGHLSIQDVQTSFVELFPNKKRPQLKVFHEVGKTGYEHTHVVHLTTKRVKLDSHKKWTSFRNSLGNFNLQRCKSDLHFANMLEYSNAKGKTETTSTVVLDEIGSYSPPEAYHDTVIHYLETTASWKACLKGPHSKYICSKLNWARQLWTLSRCVVDFQFPSGNPYEWQEHVITFLDGQPDNRTVHWFCDLKGGSGKSDLTNWLSSHRSCFVADTCSHKDIAHAYDSQRIVIFDLSRSKEEMVPYATMESFKNGRIFSGKYQSRMKTFDVPHVVVFANYMPEKDALSADRWDIIELEEGKLSHEMTKKSSRVSS